MTDPKNRQFEKERGEGAARPESGRLVEKRAADQATSREGAARPGKGYVPPEELSDGATDLTAVAEQLGLELIVPLRPEDIDRTAALRIPEPLARKYVIIAVRYNPVVNRLLVATADPHDLSLTDELPGLISCAGIDLALAVRADIQLCIEDVYRRVKVLGTIARINEQSVSTGSARLGGVVIADEDDATEAEVQRIVNAMLGFALAEGASDVSIEPASDRVNIRMKINGRWRFIEPPPNMVWHDGIVSWCKIHTNSMDISKKRQPQDGRIAVQFRAGNYDLRVASMPSNGSEMVTLRVQDPANAEQSLEKIGFSASGIQAIDRVIHLPNGVVLVTGPTGSGKTTTLYSLLVRLRDPERKIVTIEDPIEYALQGLNQTEINEQIGFGFDEALRAALRQAPDVILVGEIRDLQTAATAMRAALTGHMVFSTLHTNDAASTITRLVDMKIPPFLIAEALRAIFAQRLVRRLCPHCGNSYRPDQETRSRLGISAEANLTGLKQPTGCQSCDEGYKGRLAIYELLLCSRDIQALILQGADTDKIRRKAIEAGMRTMRQDGVIKAVTGLTTLGEVERATLLM